MTASKLNWTDLEDIDQTRELLQLEDPALSRHAALCRALDMVHRQRERDRKIEALKIEAIARATTHRHNGKVIWA